MKTSRAARIKNVFPLQLLQWQISRACWLPVYLMLATAVAVNADDFTYTINPSNTNTITITGYTGSGGAVVIPSNLLGKTVTRIGDTAFWGCASLTSVTIPNSVTYLGDCAFTECTNLSSITIPNSVTHLGTWALASCTQLTGATIGYGVTSIGGCAFNQCSSLTAITVDALNPAFSSLDGVLFNKNRSTLKRCPGGKTGTYTIPNSVTTIAWTAFMGCGSLTNVTIPASVTSMESETFRYCISLVTVTIPSSVTDIGWWTFDSCTSLTSITIPDSVANIGGRAFSYCVNLTSAMIGNGVTSIGDNAFFGNSGLTGIFFKGNAPSLGSGVFGLCNNATVYYLQGTTGWPISPATFGGRPTVLLDPAPLIISQPTSLAVNMGGTAILSVNAIGSLPLTYQWLHNGQSISGATNSTLTIGNVHDSDFGRYSVLVANTFGTTSSSVAYLAIVAGAVFEQEVSLTTYQEVPQKDTGQDSLVIITHGWQEKFPWQSDPDPNANPWVTEMADAIRERLASLGKNNWRVQPYFWIADSWTEIADSARGNAERHGDALGARIGAQHWTHVHLIAHSAGAALIQAAAEKIKQVWPTTIVHTTFLDPFVGFTTSGRLEYGRVSNWADSYFAEDMTGYTTSRKLQYAHNVNVTSLDPDRTETPYYCSDASQPSVNQAALSSHGWPHDFYTLTVPPYFMPDSSGYGYPLSKEAGGWSEDDGSDQQVFYPKNNWPPVELGTSFPCLQFINPIPTSTAPSFNLDQLQSAISTIGAAMFANSFELNSSLPLPQQQRLLASTSTQTNSTSWISLAIPVSNTVNYLSFSAVFTSATGSEGLMTVYWNTNSIGIIDERMAVPGTQTYRFPLPGTYTEGLYSLNFRLDSFNSITSHVNVADVALGFAGNTEPFSLGIAPTGISAGVAMTLAGAPGNNYIVTSSTNLVDWAAVALLANTNGSVRFFDPGMSNCQHRFYRAKRQ